MQHSIYGTTIPIFREKKLPGFSITSNYRIKKYYEDNWEEVFQILNLHELAHLFGVPNPTRNDVIDVLGKHCIRADCVMGQVNVYRQVLEKDGSTTFRFIDALEQTENILERKERTGDVFCSACRNDLEKGKRKIASLL